MTSMILRAASDEERFETIHAQVSKLSPAIKAGFFTAISAAAALPIGAFAALETAISEGNATAAAAVVPLSELTRVLERELADTLGDAFSVARKPLVQLDPELADLDTAHVRAQRLITDEARKVATGIGQGSEAAVREELQRAIRLGENPRIVAKRIEGMIGLDERQARAVANLRMRLVKNGTPRQEIERRAAAATRRHLAVRAERIARTEIMWAHNAAQEERWLQAAQRGIIPMTSERVWITAADERVCPQCAPMNGMIVDRLDTPFTSQYLGLPGQTLKLRPAPVTTLFPPLHPNCRCTVGLA